MVMSPQAQIGMQRATRVEHFLPRLKIRKKGGDIAQIAPLYPEQWRMVEAFKTHQQICIVKPRQMGATTITQALLFWWAWRAPKSAPLDVLTVGHEQGSCNRVNRMIRFFAQNLPRQWRRPLAIDNASEIVLGHNNSTFRQVMAGGRGQGRSYTYQCVCFTEVGKYPRGAAAATGDSDGDDADEEVVQSTLATVHDSPRKRVILESTGDGGKGIFQKMAYQAFEDPSWAFLAFRWFDFEMYTKPVPVDFEPTPGELDLAREHGLTLGQLVWRRHKLTTEGYTALRFRREYPEHWTDPFKPNELGAWFDVELLDRLLQRLPPPTGEKLRIWHRYERGRKYGIGVDTSGGTGRDDAAIYVVRDDFEIVARWFCNKTDLLGQARKAVWLQNLYGGREHNCILTEANNFGRPVIKEIERLGGRTWKDEKAKDWWTQDGRSGQSKRILYGWGRRIVNEQICCSIREGDDPLMNDPLLVQQMMSIREDDKSKIEAPEGDHDDLVDGYLLACWAVRRHHEARARQQKRREESSSAAAFVRAVKEASRGRYR